jgi:hypothetical protein
MSLIQGLFGRFRWFQTVSGQLRQYSMDSVLQHCKDISKLHESDKKELIVSHLRIPSLKRTRLICFFALKLKMFCKKNKDTQK